MSVYSLYELKCYRETAVGLSLLSLLSANMGEGKQSILNISRIGKE
jgi:hypothetical protein